MRSSILTFAALLSVAGSPCLAQSSRGAPSGADIAQKARATRFNPANAGTGTFQGKSMKLTPAALAVASLDELKAGQVIGILENDAAGDETGLPPGRYNLFVAFVDGQWRGYAEAGGKIISPAVRTRIANAGAGKTPTFQQNGWCFTLYWGSMMTVLVSQVLGVGGYQICF
jgi:hypothetical protein